MFITADQLLAHLVGDYILQSDWMANEKTKSNVAASIHAFCYTLCFFPLIQSSEQIGLIFWSHFFIDRFRLARYLVWLKNWLGRNRPWRECSVTGYPDPRPAWMSVWLLIIADNILHIVINGLALKYL